jgi:hypothetical protein
MSLWNTVEFTHVALGLVPKVLNPVDVIFLVCKEFGVVDSKVMEIRYVQHVIAAPAVRINDSVRNDFTFDDRQQGC